MAKLIENKIDSVARTRAQALNVYTPITVNDFIVSRGDIVAYLKGRVYGSWIDDYSRSNGYSEGDFIENPVYIIESIIRDEIQSEINLIASDVTSDGSNYYISFAGASGAIDGLGEYVGATLWGFTSSAYYPNGWKAKITAYNTISKTVTIPIFSHSSVLVGDSFKITNKNHLEIDYANFDALGNTTNGALKDYKARKSITQKINSNDLLKSLLYEFSLRIVRSKKKIKLVRALETKTTPDGTFNKPVLASSGIPMIAVNYTNLDMLFTDYEFEYLYIHSKEKYREKFIINNNMNTARTAVYESYSSFSAERTKIASVVNNYRLYRQFVYQCQWIKDYATFTAFAKKIISLHTKQRAIVTYTGEFSTHIQYEEGDVVTIDYDKVMPASLNGTAQFQIQSKSIDTSKNRIITFTLMEI